ncbi:sugar phosphate isomerase/epimerase [Alteromonas sp. BL110]|uniref:sugar phosphate isomerase/epimerase family protein n=1 Tax=Alteromonas sp. BL110 TaxID=1714845 RepID=UPI000E499F1C|nr:TIM barrel protein [Alteromonas sp. BL110]AXT40305.1 sugar phosphate isomerase/epimerase [Alteromonas sp. BL110]RKM79537.1 sugar phosphate isomerase/epimerase [Alteromonas sp. BL110]
MNLSVCTISFRHQLISIAEIAKWSVANSFQGIELWGAHATNLEDQPLYGKEWLSSYSLRATMLSDYLPLFEERDALYFKVHRLCRLAKHWGATKIRTFASNEASSDITEDKRHLLFERLKLVCDWLSDYDLNLVIETHPNTYADSVASTIELFEGVNKKNLQLNYDVLHVWESGADVIASCELLAPYINHFHFKNISSSKHLSVFAPDNVYAAAGSREGMVPIFDGAVDYQGFIEHLYSKPQLRNIDSSLEWFGNDCKNVLSHDRYKLQKMSQAANTAIAI